MILAKGHHIKIWFEITFDVSFDKLSSTYRSWSISYQILKCTILFENCNIIYIVNNYKPCTIIKCNIILQSLVKTEIRNYQKYKYYGLLNFTIDWLSFGDLW